MTKPKRNVFAILDVGSSKTVCLVLKAQGNSLKILGIGYRSSEGLDGGAVSDIKKASHSILSTIDAAEQVAEESIDQVYVNLSGCNILSRSLFNEITSTNHEICERDIRRVTAQSFEKINSSDIIVHNIPVKYLVDNNSVYDPRGLYASHLSVDMHVITAPRAALVNLEHCIAKCYLSLAGCSISAYTSGLACLTEDEKEVGVAVIDIGGMYTSIGVFSRGNFIYAHTIPIGGLNITRDIAFGLHTTIKEAEVIKIKYGNVISTPSNCNLSFNLADSNLDKEDNYINLSELTKIIRPRVEEILDIVMNLLSSKSDKFHKIVITGGSSKIEGLKELSSFVFGKPVRLGVPKEILTVDNIYKNNPVFSSAIGAAILVLNTFFATSHDVIHANRSFVDRFLDFIKFR